MIWTTEEIVRHFRQAKNQKRSIQILADLNNTGEDEIRAVLERAGEIKPAEPKPDPFKKKGYSIPSIDDELAMKLYNQGMMDKEIAEKMNLSVSTIWRWRNSQRLPFHEKRAINKTAETDTESSENTSEPSDTYKHSLSETDYFPHISPVILKIQKLLDMVGTEDSAKVAGQRLDLMITMLTDEVQRIVNEKSRSPVSRPERAAK